MKSFFYCSKAEKFLVRNQNGSNPSPPIIIKKDFYMKSFFYCSKAEKFSVRNQNGPNPSPSIIIKKDFLNGFRYEVCHVL